LTTHQEGVVIEETGVANLQKVDNIVVLMLENRSFDHMLGYLSLEGGRTDVDGLRAQFANEHDGRRYPVHHLASTAIPNDPDHSADAVDPQIGGGTMDGFVASFAATLASREVQDADPRPGDGLLQQRGRSGLRSSRERVRDLRSVVQLGSRGRPGPTARTRSVVAPPAAAMTCRRMCRRCTTIRRSYATSTPTTSPGAGIPSKGGTLRFADAHYLLGHHDRFAFFSKTNLNWKTKLEVRTDAEAPSFLEDAASGVLPSVAWIDPNFSNFNVTGFQTNNDHAPADIKDGQELAARLLRARQRRLVRGLFQR
jgi:phospholipase C